MGFGCRIGPLLGPIYVRQSLVGLYTSGPWATDHRNRNRNFLPGLVIKSSSGVWGIPGNGNAMAMADSV
jgi:hypothetical protein